MILIACGSQQTVVRSGADGPDRVDQQLTHSRRLNSEIASMS